MVDPLRPTIPELYFSTAGNFPLTETKLVPFTTFNVCATDYPYGWTLRCETTTPTSVVFRVMGKIYKKEFFPPYYLTGNWKENNGVKSFDMGSMTRVRIACRVRTRKPVWIDIVKSC